MFPQFHESSVDLCLYSHQNQQRGLQPLELRRTCSPTRSVSCVRTCSRVLLDRQIRRQTYVACLHRSTASWICSWNHPVLVMSVSRKALDISLLMIQLSWIQASGNRKTLSYDMSHEVMMKLVPIGRMLQL
jgi:hypothetical protein